MEKQFKEHEISSNSKLSGFNSPFDGSSTGGLIARLFNCILNAGRVTTNKKH